MTVESENYRRWLNTNMLHFYQQVQVLPRNVDIGVVTKVQAWTAVSENRYGLKGMSCNNTSFRGNELLTNIEKTSKSILKKSVLLGTKEWRDHNIFSVYQSCTYL